MLIYSVVHVFYDYDTDDLDSDVIVKLKSTDGNSLTVNGTELTERHIGRSDPSVPSITVDHLNASWSMQQSALQLHDISFNVNKVSEPLNVGVQKCTLLFITFRMLLC